MVSLLSSIFLAKQDKFLSFSAFDKFKKEPAEKDGAVIDTNLTSEGHMEVVEYKVPVEKERSGATDESNNGE